MDIRTTPINDSYLPGFCCRARRSRAAGQLDVTLDSATEADRLGVEIDARVRGGAAGGEWDVMVALFENDLVTPVPRGENTGRTLRNTRVVRRLEKAFSLPAQAGNRRSGRHEIELDAAWRRDRIGVAVFLQDPASLEIHGATTARLGDG